VTVGLALTFIIPVAAIVLLEVVLIRTWDTCPVRGARHLTAWPRGRFLYTYRVMEWVLDKLEAAPRCQMRVADSASLGREFFRRCGSRILRAWGEQKPHEDAAFWVFMH